jgi:S1-C subfamily serine protease
MKLGRLLFGLVWLVAVSSGHGAGLVDVVARTKLSIAAVGSYSAMDNPRFTFRGTGFVVGDGNSLVTNAHVLPERASDESKTSLAIQTAAGPGRFEWRHASVTALDTEHDLVLLRFEGSPMPALSLAAAADIREGLSVAFMGFPLGGVLGFTPVTHRGIISSITPIAMPTPTSNQLKDQNVRRLREGTFDIYQLDATSYPGNSGGPLVNADTGEVVGVLNMGLIRGSKESAITHPMGISYAIPARFVDELMKRK